MQLKRDNSKMENFKILEEKENKLFNRKEIKFNIEAEITPNHVEVEKFISEKFSVQSEVIKIRGIHGRFGSKIFTITANIYESIENKEDVEPKKKGKIAEEKPAEVPVEKPIEQPIEEQKTEEVSKEKTGSEEKSEEKKKNNKEEGKLMVKKINRRVDS